MQCKLIGFQLICIALFLWAVHENLVNCCLRVVVIGVNFVCNGFFCCHHFLLDKNNLMLATILTELHLIA
jgi:hypothetical protein